MEKDWVLIFTSAQLQKVELLKQFLQKEGIDSVVLNQQDFSYTNIGDIKLLVKNTDGSQAIRTVEKAGL